MDDSQSKALMAIVILALVAIIVVGIVILLSNPIVQALLAIVAIVVLVGILKRISED